MEELYTIAENYELPSKGLIYDKSFDPRITIRSMTTRQEMRRLAPTTTPYKILSDIIEECLVEKLPIHVYDLCIGDYEYLLHKLRVVSHSPEYKMGFVCPSCGHVVNVKVNLDEIEVIEFDKEASKEWEELLELHLPKSDKTVRLQYQTPRILDEISTRVNALKKRFTGSQVDFELQATLEYAIDTVDGEKLDVREREAFIDKLPVKDMNIILNRIQELNKKVGLKTDNILVDCPDCGYQANTFFRFGPEFFRPTED